MIVVIILACLFTLLLARVPVAFALGFLGLAMLIVGGFSPLMAPQASPAASPMKNATYQGYSALRKSPVTMATAPMIEPIETAMGVARARNKPVKEDWYGLLNFAYFSTEN